jgi:hypothetical protein
MRRQSSYAFGSPVDWWYFNASGTLEIAVMGKVGFALGAPAPCCLALAICLISSGDLACLSYRGFDS